jgi:hypothetical protein
MKENVGGETRRRKLVQEDERKKYEKEVGGGLE